MQLYNSLLARLTSQYQTMAALISGIDEERLLKRPAPGKWNIQDNIAHLAVYQPVFIERINKILSSHRPTFGRYRADNDPEFEAWRSLPIDDLLHQINTDRQLIIELLNRLTETELSRIGTHPNMAI